MGEIVTGHDARTEFPQIQWPTLYGKTDRVMVHRSGVPERDRLSWNNICGSLQSYFRVSLLSIQLKGHIFPASGYRNNSNGSLNNVGSNGYYWTATPYSTNNGRNLNFNSSNTNWNNNNRANGFPVRAVAEAFADQWILPFLNLFTNGHHR